MVVLVFSKQNKREMTQLLIFKGIRFTTGNTCVCVCVFFSPGDGFANGWLDWVYL